MKKLLLLVLTLTAATAAMSVAAQSKPKRLLLVTVSNGFRHSSIETTEKVIRELAAKSGDFVVISTSDHPDYPDYSASAGGPRAGDAAWGSPFGPQLLDGTPAQQMFIRRLNDRALSPLSPLEFAARKARADLATASLTERPGSAALAARADAVAKADLALALAKATQFQTLQASENRLTPQQVQVLAGHTPSAPATGSSFAPQVGAATPRQQKAIAAANASPAMTALAAAVNTARTELTAASFSGDSAAVRAKADALATAESKLAVARADEFARIQASAGRFARPVVNTMISRASRPGTGNAYADAAARVMADMLSPEALKNYDGVFFASTVGTLPFPDLEGFYAWVRNGGAWLGNHASSDSMHGVNSYFDMMGGEFTGHGSQTTEVMTVMDTNHPIGKAIGANTLTARDEMYTFENANFDFSKVRSILNFTAAMNDGMHAPVGAPGQWPVIWIKTYGKGRVFYSALGHREDVVDPVLTALGENTRQNPPEVAQAYQRMLLAGIRWSLGLIDGDATPQIKVPTPAGGPGVTRPGRGGGPAAAPGAATPAGGRGGR